MMKENQFRISIHKHMVKEKPHNEKMHNPYRGGTADDWYSGTKRDVWIEYKWQPKLKSVLVSKLASPLQYLWLTRRHEEGRNVLVIVGFPQGGIVIYPHEFDKRVPVTTVELRLLKRKALADFITEFTME
jgi:hypothetical protein